MNFREPTEAQVANPNAIQDLGRLDRIAVTLLSARTRDGVLRVR